MTRHAADLTMQDPQHDPPTPGCIAAIVPAAGSGRRFGGEQNKLFAQLAGKPLWYRAVERLRGRSEIGRLVMPVSPADLPEFEMRFQSQLDELRIELVLGGAERTDSVRAALQTLDGDDQVRLVAVHDAARPLVSSTDLAAVFAIAAQTGAAILATPVVGTLKRATTTGGECETIDRRDLWIALTPQVFRIELLRQAYDRHRGRAATDDAQLVERAGYPVTLVPGSADNLKITHPEDLSIAAALYARQTQDA